MDRIFFRTGGAWLRALAFALVLAGLGATPVWAGAPEGVVNVNTATVEQLTRLPGVGESRAKAIVALRQKRGSFRKVDDLTAVRGIGDASMAKLRPFLALEGRTTLPPQ